MKKLKEKLIIGATLLATATLPLFASQQPDAAAPETEEVVTTETENPVWTADNLNDNERAVLKFLQEQGITDKVALATVMGNIKQESKFETEICEGGARVKYEHCHSGGFGLIQWTTKGRYNGLGLHARRLGLCPSALEAQLSWMVNEREWKKVEHIFKSEGRSISSYMQAAYRWLGWGVEGARSHYANQYSHYLHFE